MPTIDRRVRRTQDALHRALISLTLEKKYDAITVQEVADRANVGRSTFYAHFDSIDDLLVSRIRQLRVELNTALQREKTLAKRHESVIGFSRAMFEHAGQFREVHRALSGTRARLLVQQGLQEILQDLIRQECKVEIAKLKRPDSEVPLDLFVNYLTAAFFSVLMWWLHTRSRMTPERINQVFCALVLPTVHAVLG